MRRNLARLWACGKGASAVEFALLVMPLLLLIFGVCEYGRLIWTQSALQETAMAGARCVGLLQNDCAQNGVLSTANSTAFIQSVASGWLVTLPPSSVVVTTSATCGGISGFVSVTLNYTFVSAVPQFVSLSANGTALTATACFPMAS